MHVCLAVEDVAHRLLNGNKSVGEMVWMETDDPSIPWKRGIIAAFTEEDGGFYHIDYEDGSKESTIMDNRKVRSSDWTRPQTSWAYYGQWMR